MKTPTRRRLVTLVAVALLAAGGGLMAKPVWHWSKRVVNAHRARQRWEDFCRDPVHRDRPPVPGDPVGWLRFPDAGVDELVLLGAGPENLSLHPCLVPAPAGSGLRVILGHRDSHFSELGAARPGQALSLVRPDGGVERCRIDHCEIMVSEALPGFLQARHDRAGMVLVTCYPFDFIGPAPQRFVVWAPAQP